MVQTYASVKPLLELSPNFRPKPQVRSWWQDPPCVSRTGVYVMGQASYRRLSGRRSGAARIRLRLKRSEAIAACRRPPALPEACRLKSLR